MFTSLSGIFLISKTKIIFNFLIINVFIAFHFPVFVRFHFNLIQSILIFQIGQSHGGFLGILQRALARASSHIWFERSEVKDRHAVAKRLKEHVSDKTKPPILIFPEGTCINNTSVMQFKKGSFEVGGTVYPVAIKVKLLCRAEVRR